MERSKKFDLFVNLHFLKILVLAQPIHSNIVPAGAQQSQLPLHPPQQPTPQPQIPGQHVGQGSVIPMAYFVQQQAFSAPPHAQQAIGIKCIY